MSDSSDEKTDLDKLRDIISQLREMQHYSKNNIERLTEIWLHLDDELKQKDMAKRIESLLTAENELHDTVESIASDMEIECNRIANEAG